MGFLTTPYSTKFANKSNYIDHFFAKDVVPVIVVGIPFDDNYFYRFLVTSFLPFGCTMVVGFLLTFYSRKIIKTQIQCGWFASVVIKIRKL